LQRTAPTTQERPAGIKRKHRLHNPTRHAEVEDNIAAVPLQVDEITGGIFEPLTPVPSDSVRAAQFFFATAMALQQGIVGIQINGSHFI
jgi:hypothetical protein